MPWKIIIFLARVKNCRIFSRRIVRRLLRLIATAELCETMNCWPARSLKWRLHDSVRSPHESHYGPKSVLAQDPLKPPEALRAESHQRHVAATFANRSCLLPKRAGMISKNGGNNELVIGEGQVAHSAVQRARSLSRRIRILSAASRQRFDACHKKCKSTYSQNRSLRYSRNGTPTSHNASWLSFDRPVNGPRINGWRSRSK